MISGTYLSSGFLFEAVQATCERLRIEERTSTSWRKMDNTTLPFIESCKLRGFFHIELLIGDGQPNQPFARSSKLRA